MSTSRRFLDWLKDPSVAEPSGALLSGRASTLAALAAAAAAYGENRAGEIETVTLDCRQGCAHCCHFPVEVTIAEALALWQYAIAHLSASAFQALLGRITGMEVDPSFGTPCPLLVNKACSVYPARPLACRGFNSVDAAACAAALAGRSRQIRGDARLRALYLSVSNGLARGLTAEFGPPHTLTGALQGLARHPEDLEAGFEALAGATGEPPNGP